MTATKNNVPPSSTLVMTVLVPCTSPSRKACTATSFRSLTEHRAYTPRRATYENTSSSQALHDGCNTPWSLPRVWWKTIRPCPFSDSALPTPVVHLPTPTTANRCECCQR
jgi:hypothetical protein